MEFYRDFYDNSSAEDFGALLGENDIHFSIEYTKTLIDSTFVGTSLIPTAIIKIRPEDFEAVNDLLIKEVDNFSNDDVENSTLSNYTTDDLQKVISDQGDWNIEDVYLARRVLEMRGVPISIDDVKSSVDQGVLEQSKGKSASTLWQLVYGAFVIGGHFISIILPIAGIGMGYYYGYGQKTDMSGNKHYVYDQDSRNVGKVILYGGVVFASILYAYIYMSDDWTLFDDTQLYY